MVASELALLIGQRVTSLRATGRNTYRGKCPFVEHEHDDRSPAFYVFADRDDGHGRYKCHKCQAAGNEITWRKFIGDSTPVVVDSSLPRRLTEEQFRRAVIATWRNSNPDCPDEAEMFIRWGL